MFRDLASFNLALLTNQAWPITTQPELILARIMKARYFPTTDFFLAEVGERPSLTWRRTVATKAYFRGRIKK